MTDVMDDYNEVNRVELVNAVVAQDKDAFMQAFHNAIAQKVSDALEIKKVEIASNLLGQEEVPNETEGNQTEVDGSGDEISFETSTEENA